MKKRLITLLAVICLAVILLPMTVSAATPENGWYQDGDIWYYYVDGEPVTNQVMQIGGDYYGFDSDGWMYDDQEFWCQDSWYRAREGGKLYVNSWVNPWNDALFYYGADAKALQDFHLIDGTWYYFGWDGTMLKDDCVWSEDYQNYYVLSKDGKSHKSFSQAGWSQIYGDWYFTVAESEGVYTPLHSVTRTISGVKYAFDYTRKMVCDSASDSSVYLDTADSWVYVVADKDGKLVENGWYQSAGGDWYYTQNYEACHYGVYELEGKEFFFDGECRLVINDWVNWYDQDQGTWICCHTNGNGELIKNGWFQADGQWYYAENYERVTYGIYTIGGSMFAFDYDGALYTTPGRRYFQGDYIHVANSNGNLLVNQWKYSKLDDEWYFYGAEALGLNGVHTVNGKIYCFDEGRMLTETVRTDDAVYVFDKDGVGTIVNGWFKHPGEGEWMYADGTYLASDEILTIGGVKYAFDCDGFMISDGYYWDYNNDCYYLFGAGGQAYTKKGWYQADGSWYLVQADGSLAEGWHLISGKWYYFWPEMVHDTMMYSEEDNAWFAFNKNGHASKLTGTGWKSVSWGRIYLKDGTPIQNKWEYIDGAWYYFWFDGEPHNGGHYYIEANDAYYGFDESGKMLSACWNNGHYYYGNGKAATGIVTIGGVQYIFSDSGYLWDNGCYTAEDGTSYYTVDGVVQFSFTQAGWIYSGGKWYYALEDEYDWYDGDYYLAYGREYINNNYYLFSTDTCALLTNGLYLVYGNWYLTDSEGIPKTGWQYYGGNWYYADPDGSGWLYDWGSYWVDEDNAYYLFKDCVLQLNATMIEGTTLYTSNGSGKIIKETPLPDGWTYSEEEANYLYIKDGQYYNGWVGDYYIQHGYMVFNSTIDYNDAVYYLRKDGLCARNGWYKTANSNWVYARADGSLYYNEWLYQGGIWYYFDSYYMATYTCWIDGEYHDFDDNGKWLGKVSEDDGDMPVKSDGWHLINGKWYYYHAGDPVSGRHYIDGAWYFFGSGRHYYFYDSHEIDEESCYMATNVYDHYYYYDKCFYYGADGKRVNYTGWKKIDGQWYFFNQDHSMASGLQKINGKWYYFDWYNLYDEETGVALPMCGAPAMVSNYAEVIDGKLYIFGADGACNGPTTANGWHKAGSDWYFVRNGQAVYDDLVQINGKWYYFFYDGAMAYDDVVWTNMFDDWAPTYFGADGAMVTKTGWYKITWNDNSYDWIFVGADGTLYENGIYRIGGKEYTFHNYFLFE